MAVNDVVFLALPAGYIVVAVTLGVLSNRLPVWRVTALSAATMVGMVAFLGQDCLKPGVFSLDCLILLLMYVGGPLLIGFVVPFIAGRYVARVVFRIVGAQRPLRVPARSDVS